MWKIVTKLFREYMGTGLTVILYLISLVYLWVKEERRYVRLLFVSVPVILLLLFFNPLFAGVLYRLGGEEVYYRVLWLLPITVTIALAAATLYGNLPDRRRMVFALAAAAGIMVSGSCIYSNPYFQKAENLYHVPDSVVHLCDAIRVRGREVQAVFPLELVQYIRQYDPTICMPYGREMTVERWNQWDDLLYEMEAEEIDLSRLAPLTKEAGCHYIILPEEKEIIGNPAEYAYVEFIRTDGYVVYRDVTFSLDVGSVIPLRISVVEIQGVHKAPGEFFPSCHIQVEVVDQVFVGIVFRDGAVEVVHKGDALRRAGGKLFDHVGGEDVLAVPGDITADVVSFLIQLV